MKNRSGEKIKLASIDELLGVVNEESAMEIEISKIHPFKNHPFKVLDDEKMQDLVESVKINGVLTPVLLRMDENEEYEMVSGHRRMHAAQLAGLTTIPAIVRELSDDDAIVAMVDANIQREELLPSEKAFAYKMKLEAMKRKAGRPSKGNTGQIVPNLTTDIIGETEGISGRQVKRFIRLTELIPELLDLVDNKKLQFTVAVDISYIDKEVQEWIYEYISDTGFIKPKQIASLRNQLNDGPINQIQMLSIFNVELNNRIVCFDIKELGKQLKKIGMLIVQDQVWNRVTINRGIKSTRYYIDEFHLLLKEEQTAAYSVEIWKRFRKWGGVPTGITQNIKDLLASREIENIFENSDFILMLNQAAGDRQILAKQLNISPYQLSYVTNSGEGEGLLFYGTTIIPFKDKFDKNLKLYSFSQIFRTGKPCNVSGFI